MFQFPHLPHPPSKGGVPAHHGGGLPHSEISGSACQRLPGAFRSVTTSFFGPGCQGIHHMPLFACDSSAFPLRSFPRCRFANLQVHAETVVKQHYVRALLWSLISHLIGVVVFRLVRNWFPTAPTSAVLLVENDVHRSIRLLLVAWYSLGNVLLPCRSSRACRSGLRLLLTASRRP
jgi:hypothetical protein